MGARIDLQLRRKDGLLVPVEIGLSPLTGSEDDTVLCTIRDISRQERRSKEDILVTEIGRIVNSNRNVRNVYEAVAALMPPLIPFDRLVVTLRQADSDLVRREFVTGLRVEGGEEGTEVIAAVDTGAARGPYVATSLAGLLIRDEPLVDEMGTVGLNSFVEAPLGDSENPFGYLSLRSTERDAYDANHVRLLERITAQISPAIENARLYERARDDAHEKAVLAEVSRIITSTSDIDQVYALVADQIRELVPFDRIVISTVDYERNLVTDRYVAGVNVKGGQAGATYPLDNSATGDAIKDLQGRWFGEEELQHIAARYPEVRARNKAGFKSAITAPMLWDHSPIGILILRSKQEAFYGEAEAAIAEKVANQISGAVANAELAALREREIAEKLALSHIGRMAGSTLDFNVLGNRTAKALRPLIDFQRISVMAVDEVQMRGNMVFSRPKVEYNPAQYRQPNWSLQDSTPHLAVTTRKSVSFGDHNRGELSEELPGLKRSIRAGLRSGITTPVFHENKVVATLSVQSESRASFTKTDIDLLENVAVQIGTAIVNAALHQRVERELRESAALAKIGRIISSTADPRSIYERFAAILQAIIASDRILVSILDEERMRFRHELVWENGRLAPVSTETYEVRGFPIEEIMRTRSTTLLFSKDEAELAKRFPAIRPALPAGVFSTVLVPLIASDEVIGAL